MFRYVHTFLAPIKFSDWPFLKTSFIDSDDDVLIRNLQNNLNILSVGLRICWSIKGSPEYKTKLHLMVGLLEIWGVWGTSLLILFQGLLCNVVISVHDDIGTSIYEGVNNSDSHFVVISVISKIWKLKKQRSLQMKTAENYHSVANCTGNELILEE